MDKPTLLCPNCGAREIYHSRVDALAWGSAGNLLPKVGGLLHPPKFDCCVCGACGLVRFFVPQEWLDDVRKKWEKTDA